MKKVILLCFLVQLSVSFLVTGCSNLVDGKNSNNSNSVSVPNKKGDSLISFDQKLASIKDQETAQDAVNHFANRVISNTESRTYTSESGITAGGIHSASITVQSLNYNNFLTKAAQVEAKIRQKKSGINAQDVDTSDTVTPEKLTQVINSMKTSDDNPDLTVEQLKYTQQLIRDNIPHLAPNSSESMTPLEASVLTYYILTGDTGSDEETSQKLHADTTDIQTFTNKITDSQGVQ